MTELLRLPTLASRHGADVDALMVYMHWVMVALFIGWLAYFVYALWRFRQSRNPKADYRGVTGHASTWVEGAVIIAEAVLLLGFAIPWWAGAVDTFPAENQSIVVRVTARQFNWIARYAGPDGKFGKQDIALRSPQNSLGLVAKDPTLKDTDPDGKDDAISEGTSEIYIPVNTNIIIHITSLDVVHSFKVLSLRVTQDAIPGMSIPIHFVATRTNTYQINCAQLCGIGHSTMKGLLKVVSQPEFETWIKSKSGAGAGVFE